MALRLVIRTTGGETWEELAKDAPTGWIFPRPGGGLLLRRGEMSSTGVHLLASEEEGTLVIELPLFMGATDYVALTAFVPKVCERVGADTVEVGGEHVPVAEFERVVDDQIAPELAQHALSKLPELRNDPDAVLVIEGRERPFLLGKHTLERLEHNAGADDLYDTIVELVSRVQELVRDEATFLAPAQGVIRDGERLVVTSWDPEVRTLTMPCDILEIAHGGATYAVPSEHIADVVRGAGLLIDEHSWLLGPPRDLEALLERAREHAEKA